MSLNNSMRVVFSTVLCSLICIPGLFAQTHSGTSSAESAKSSQLLLVDQGSSSSSSRSQGSRQKSARNVLQTPVTLNLQNVTLDSALHEIDRQAKLGLFYSERVVPVKSRVSINVRGVSAKEALESVLSGTGVILKENPDGKVTLVSGSSSTGNGSQQGTGEIKGRVVDSVSGEGLSGVTITVVGSRLGAISRSNGSFTVSGISDGQHTLNIRILGYVSKNVAVTVVDGTARELRVVLQTAATSLNEVVTTATGQQRRIEIGNDITRVNADSITRRMPIHTMTDLLRDYVDGVQLQQQSGAPGAPTRIRIRGLTSISGTNDPIVIVDGVRIYANQFSQGLRGPNDPVAAPGVGVNDRSSNMATNTANSSGNDKYYVSSPIDQIDPNSVQYIEVLKGPSAVALYGTDAANGVIVITTKKGQAGPTQWSIGGTWGIDYFPGKWPMNYYRWGHTANSTAPMQCTVLAERNQLNPCTPDSLSVYQVLNDDYTTVFGTGNLSTYRGDVRGGNNGLTYAFSGSVQSQLGNMKISDADMDILADSGVKPTKWQRRPQASEMQSGQVSIQSEVNERLRVNFSSMINRSAMRTTPLQQGVNIASRLDPPSANRLGSGILVDIPDWRNKITSENLRLVNAVTVTLNPFWLLSTTATGGFDINNRKDESYLKRGDCYSGFGAPSSGPCGQFGNRDMGFWNTVNGTARVTSVRLGAVAPITLNRGVTLRTSIGSDYTRTITNDMSRSATGLPNGATSGNGAEDVISGSNSDDRITAGVYAEVNVGIMDRIYFPLALRTDAGSGLGKSVRPKFPKISMSYLLSDDPYFVKSGLSDFVNTLRVRFAYGQSGRQPGIANVVRTYRERRAYIDTLTSVPILAITSMGNSFLKPEVTAELEGGFDVDLMDDRISWSITMYRKQTRDALVTEPLPLSLGNIASPSGSSYSASNWQRNIGDVRNTGWETNITAGLLRMSPVTWDMTLGLSANKNILQRYAATSAIVPGSNLRLGGGIPNQSIGVAENRFVEGYPLYGIWVVPVTAWSDLNGDGYIGGSEVQIGDTMVYAGAPTPKVQMTMGHNATFFGRLTVGANFRYENGATQLLSPGNNSYNTYSRAFNDPSTPLATQAYLVGALTRGAAGGSAIGYIQKVSTFRFNSLSIGYMVPREYTARMFRDKQVRLSLQGTNLGLITNYRGVDPNVNASMAEYNRDTGGQPMPRSWQISVGIN